MSTHNLSLVKTKKGNFSLRVKCNDGSEKLLHSLYDPEREATTIVDTFDFDRKGLLVVLGLGLGYHLVELTQRFPDTEVVVIEAVSEIYEIAREHGKVSEISDRVRFVVGLPTNETIKEISRHQIKAGVAPLSVFSLSSAISAFPDYYQLILTRLNNTVSVRLWEKFRYPKFKEDVIKVALIDSGYFLTREVERTIKGLGHRVLKVPIHKGEEGEVIVSGLKIAWFIAVLHCWFTFFKPRSLR
ncbi:MAG: hypothetical protein ACE5IH_08325 [Thermodesulfobacteriota bacterium]